MSTPTCTKCDRPFPANGELASLAHGKRVAFDPELGRVWRICTRCGEWSLVGAEAASAVARELTTRLSGTGSRAIVHDAIGELDVIVVASDAVSRPATAAALKEKRDLLTAVSPLMWLVHGAIGMASVITIAGFWREVDWLEWGIPLVLALYAAGRAGDMVVARAVGKPIARWMPISAAAAAVALCAGILLRGYSAIWLAAIPAAALVPPLIAWIEHRFFGAAALAPDRTHVRVSRHNANRISLGLGASGSPAVFDDSSAHAVEGPAALPLIDAALFDTDWPTDSQIEQGWSILRRHGDLAGVLRAFDAARPEDQGRHPMPAFPMAWKFAIHFAIIEARGTGAEGDGIRDQIAAASEIAVIAESLDRRE